MTPPTSVEDAPVGEEKPAKVAKRRKSFVAGLFGRNAKKENEKHTSDTS